MNDKINNEHEEVVLLTEEQVKERKKRTRKTKPDNFADVKNVVDKSDIAESGLCEIVFESEGRFDIPEKLKFKPFTTLDINNITLTRQEKIVDTLISILNEKEVSGQSCDVSNMLMEEFLEVMVGNKLKFISAKHEHRWICDCQDILPSEDQEVNTSEIDLTTLNYTSISEADKLLREFYEPQFEAMSDKDFDKYKASTYAEKLTDEEIKEVTKEQALKDVKIKEPIKLNAPDGHEYSFRFNRVGDVILARKMADSSFTSSIKQAQQLRYDKSQESLADYKARKEEALVTLKEEKAKFAIHVANAMRLVAIDGVKFNNNYQRVEAYGEIDTKTTQQLSNFLDTLTFGVNDTRDFVCPLCGEIKQRSLRQELNPLEFLPIDTSPDGNRKLDSGFTISFGV